MGVATEFQQPTGRRRMAKTGTPVYSHNAEEVLEDLFASDRNSGKIMQFEHVQEVADFAQEGGQAVLEPIVIYPLFLSPKNKVFFNLRGTISKASWPMPRRYRDCC